MNNVTLIGRLVRDPELRYTPGSNTAFCQFTLAVDRNLSKEKREEAMSRGQATADFIRIVAWGRTAELCGNFLAKGRQVAVNGRIQTGSYTNQQGQKVYTTDVMAERVEFIDWGDRQAPAGQTTGASAYQNNQSGFNQTVGMNDSFAGFDDSDNDFLPYNDDSKIPF